MTRSLTRRDVLRGLAALLAAAAVGARLPGPWPGPVTPIRLAGLLSDGAAVRAVGHAYLREAPGKTSPGWLAAVLHHDAFAGGDLRALSDDALRARLAASVRRDYDAMRIVRVDGWVLAVTEARLCALATLVRDA